MNQNDKRIFSRLPQIKTISTKSGFKKFGENIDSLYNFYTEKQFSDIAKTIYGKLKSEDPEWGWAFKDYSDFKKYFSRVAIKEINTLGPSIQKCLDAKKTEIYEELEMFSKECEWYNTMISRKEKTTDEQFRGIRATDCFYVIASLLSQMYKVIHGYVSIVISEIDQDETLIETITKFDSDNKIKEQLSKKFEKEFDFLTKYDLFKDVYFKIKERSFKEASEMIRKQCGQRKVTEEYRKLSNGTALGNAKINGKYQLLRDTKNGNRNSQYIRKR